MLDSSNKAWVQINAEKLLLELEDLWIFNTIIKLNLGISIKAFEEEEKKFDYLILTHEEKNTNKSLLKKAVNKSNSFRVLAINKNAIVLKRNIFDIAIYGLANYISKDLLGLTSKDNLNSNFRNIAGLRMLYEVNNEVLETLNEVIIPNNKLKHNEILKILKKELEYDIPNIRESNVKHNIMFYIILSLLYKTALDKNILTKSFEAIISQSF